MQLSFEELSKKQLYQQQTFKLVQDYYIQLYGQAPITGVMSMELRAIYENSTKVKKSVKNLYKSIPEYFITYYPLIMNETVASILKDTKDIMPQNVVIEPIISFIYEKKEGANSIGITTKSPFSLGSSKDKSVKEGDFMPGDIVMVIRKGQAHDLCKNYILSGIITAKKNFKYTLITSNSSCMALSKKDVKEEYVLVYVSNIISSKREYMALLKFSDSPLAKRLMNPTPPAEAEIEAGKKKTLQTVKESHIDEAYKKLNEAQRNAVIMSLNQPLTLIQGPPGTGKTQTISCMISQFIQRGMQVLVCAPSNMAVFKLVENRNMWEHFFKNQKKWAHIHSKKPEKSDDEESGRKGKDEPNRRIRPKKRIVTGNSLGIQKDCIIDETDYTKSAALIEDAMNGASLVFCTLSMAASMVVSKKAFDVVIVDEVCQSIEPSSIIPLQQSVRRLVLVGDPKQLPPTIFSDSNDLSVSLFERLAETITPLILDTQYRMHSDISCFPNKTFYEGKLLDGVVLESSVPMALVDTGGEQKRNRTSLYNPREIDFIEDLLPYIMHKYKSIAIITPYKEQSIRLSENRKIINRQITVSTVDGFQGQEKDCIIVSTVRTNGIGFLNDYRRMNVALTRAKYTVIILGCVRLLEKDKIWKQLVTHLRTNLQICTRLELFRRLTNSSKMQGNGQKAESEELFRRRTNPPKILSKEPEKELESPKSGSVKTNEIDTDELETDEIDTDETLTISIVGTETDELETDETLVSTLGTYTDETLVSTVGTYTDGTHSDDTLTSTVGTYTDGTHSDDTLASTVGTYTDGTHSDDTLTSTDDLETESDEIILEKKEPINSNISEVISSTQGTNSSTDANNTTDPNAGILDNNLRKIIAMHLHKR
ncbi:regulator of nonsense transcripts 1 [Nematocida ausubeli]|nr:regulator of nonsense transcripts 1 [Nematocida ausubeli]